MHMLKVQVAVSSKKCDELIHRAFQQIGDPSIQLTESADYDSVVVMDQDALDHLRTPLRNPGGVVLITRKNGDLFARAWERGILSVVLEGDSADTLLLAIESAALRTGQVCLTISASPRLSLRPLRCRTNRIFSFYSEAYRV